ncbi:MAG: F0F1 ATP synthase subunit A [Candidatus Beckwithbacteria bacterium]|nr:F0F1 ATP synthase subunit A [Candidatus Beckwithbacteria bacterium]
MSLNISISAEPIFNFGKFAFTNSMLVSLLVTLGLSAIAFRFSALVKSAKKSGFVLFVQTIIESFYGFVQSITPQQAGRFFPLVATIFLFVILANWAGLLPGAETITWHGVSLIRGGTADLNITLALAIFSVVSVQIYGYKTLGLKYFKKFFNFSSPINFFVGILDLLSEFSRVVSFAFRLFGNIFAGEVLLAVIAFLIPLVAPLPFLGLEIFIGFIQALVFATLTLVFINIATMTEH